jgi:hypothetical protein
MQAKCSFDFLNPRDVRGHSPKVRKIKKKKRRRQEPFDLHAMLTEQTVPVPLLANVQADTKSTAKHAD